MRPDEAGGSGTMLQCDPGTQRSKVKATRSHTRLTDAVVQQVASPSLVPLTADGDGVVVVVGSTARGQKPGIGSTSVLHFGAKGLGPIPETLAAPGLGRGLGAKGILQRIESHEIMKS